MPADLLLRGGAIYSLGPRRRRARSLAVADGRVLALSDADGGLDALRGPATRTIDLHGRAVVPGLVDAHVHFGSFALAREQVDLDQAATLEAGLDLVRHAHATLPADAWLRGRGWDRNRWGRLPVAADLDAAVGERPAALSSHDGHSVWLNSAALSRLGIDASTPAPAGGVIERDAHGAPTGVLSETAQDLARHGIPEPSSQELAAAIRRALPIAAAAGLTGLHNFEDSRSLEAFRSLEAAGELTLGVYHGVPRGMLRRAREAGLRTGAGAGLVRVGPVKLFADGALGSRTAYLLEPYAGREADGYRGVRTLEPRELIEDMRLAADAGLDLAVHAIGDAAVRGVLDAYTQARQMYPALGERLLRIEHAQLVHPDDVPRFAELGVIASMQPIHAIADWRTADAHWGARARHAYAWRTLLEAGAQLAFGTDAPVEGIEPLASLHAATTRRGPDGQPAGGWYPEQRLDLEAALRAYTTGSAAAERAVQRRGSLGEGKDADLVVLAPDPFSIEPDALPSVGVELTVLGGRIVYQGAGA